MGLLRALGVHLTAGLTLAALLPLPSLLVLGGELAGLDVSRLVFGPLVSLLSELLGLASAPNPLVGAEALLVGEAGRLAARLPSRGNESLLLSLGLLAELPGLGLLSLDPLCLWLLIHLLGLWLLIHLLGLWVLVHLLGLWLLAGLQRWRLATRLLALLSSALRFRRQELLGLGVVGPLLGERARSLPELLGVAATLNALIGALDLLAGEACLLAARLLCGRDGPLLLCLGLLCLGLLCLGLPTDLLRLGLLAQLLLLERFLSVGLLFEVHG
ncbi:hypothetical protein I7X12_01320 [Halosimplex litoreum]|uniref:Uncharacterized protein n=1 Tax=Halosimplex litoreum TaxID=1198301 RepID=A0A7T3FZ47_9EURY|nr:hypothetical protein [Halosimplex litoreum]QPV63302.1 hypothetical protein I7X12_01320 [Halosimplex litoreum]